MLSSRARLVRLTLTALVLFLLVVGTFLGDDDEFPFGPFKMYAGTAHLDDPVPVMKFEGVTADGTTVDILAKEFGLRPAEVEGQLGRVRSDPSLLPDIVTAYEEMNPDAPRLNVFRVEHGTYHLVDGRPAGYTEETLAEWKRT